jgi:hypothetical protein
MTKAKFFHALHTGGAALVLLLPYIIPPLRDAIGHSATASAQVMALYTLLGKLIPRSS